MRFSPGLPGNFILVLLWALSGCRALVLDANATAAFSTSDYSSALGMSYLFYEAQRSGKLPASNRIPWRGDTFLSDCVVGGYFDAGDHLKLHFPMATSLTFLGLSIDIFGKAIEAAGQSQYAMDALRWGTDALIASHTSTNSFIGQIGDPSIDHAYWGRPEDQKGERPCYTWDMTKQPASDLAGAAAAALATASIVFKQSDPSYAEKALSHAKQLYSAASTNQGLYSSQYSSATYVYQSSSYLDDLALAAVMLWKATGDETYLSDALAYRKKPDFKQGFSLSWDDVSVMSAILLKCSGQSTSESDAHLAKFVKTWEGCNSNGFQLVGGGLCAAPLGGWGNLRYATSAAFAALIYAACESDNSKQSQAVEWATSQVNYALGSSGRSYVVGFGDNPPTHEHHRGASCPDEPAPCGWDQYNTPNPNPQVLYGALVGGPTSDGYTDVRSNFQTNEVAMDFNAGYTGALAGLLAFSNGQITPSTPSAPSPSKPNPPPKNTNPPNPSQGKCTDNPPDNRYTCAQQAAWGKCGQPWMADPICRKSCGRC